MGIRHITGPREWGAYQQAELIQQLHNEEAQEFSSIADHLGLSTVEVSRRYRAMNALKAMENDELYAEKAEPEYYRLFHELVSLPEVRTRFGWDSETDQFTNLDKAREFFELIAPQTKEATEAKLKSYSDVRKLKTIITNPAAEEILLDPARSFADALAEASQHRPPTAAQKNPFPDFLADTLTRIQQMTREELKALTPKDKKQIKKLIAELKEVLGK
jgi:DNA-binding Lrp family transcriptional regulator